MRVCIYRGGSILCVCVCETRGEKTQSPIFPPASSPPEPQAGRGAHRLGRHEHEHADTQAEDEAGPDLQHHHGEAQDRGWVVGVPRGLGVGDE